MNKSIWAENIYPEDTDVNFKDGGTQLIAFWALSFTPGVKTAMVSICNKHE